MSLLTIENRRGEIRSELSDLQGSLDTDEERGKRDSLVREMCDLDKQAAAWHAANPQPQPQQNGDSFGDLSTRASLSGYIQQRLDGSLTGAERELNAELGLRDSDIPTSMLAAPEHRADSDVTAPTNSQASEHSVLGRIFDTSLASRIGVTMQSVGTGEAVYNVLTAGVTPALVSAGSAPDAAATTFDSNSLKPLRMTAYYRLRTEDVHTVANLESALRDDLRMAMSSKLDDLVFQGSGTAPQWSGISNAIAAATAATTVVTTATAQSTLYALLDSTHCVRMSDAHLFARPAVLQKFAALGFTSTDQNALDKVMAILGSVTSTDKVPDGSSNVFSKTLIYHNSSMIQHSVLPVWQNMGLTVDSASESQAGVIKLVMHLLCNFKLLRTDTFSHVSYKTA